MTKGVQERLWFGGWSSMNFCTIYSVDFVEVESLYVMIFVFYLKSFCRKRACCVYHIRPLRNDMTQHGNNLYMKENLKVRVNSTYYKIQEQEMGVPPRNHPLCYIIEINSLAKVVNDNIEGSFYVDDFLVCFRGKDMNIIDSQLLKQLCLKQIEKLATQDVFVFSNSKLLVCPLQ